MQSGMDSGHISRKTKRITRQNLGRGTPLDAAQPLPTDLLLCPLDVCILREPLEPFPSPSPSVASPSAAGPPNSMGRRALHSYCVNQAHEFGGARGGERAMAEAEGIAQGEASDAIPRARVGGSASNLVTTFAHNPRRQALSPPPHFLQRNYKPLLSSAAQPLRPMPPENGC